jgi:hypothetical protein
LIALEELRKAPLVAAIATSLAAGDIAPAYTLLATDGESPKLDRVAGRRLKIGVCRYSSSEARIVAEGTFEPGENVTLGGDATAALVVPGWEGRPLRLVSEGLNLHLAPGMRLNMCHDGGEDHVIGTFEELSARGFRFPLRITVSRLNIGVRPGISVFAKYLGEGESQ